MNWGLSNSLMTARIGNLELGTVIVLLALALVLVGFFYLVKNYVIPLLESEKELKRTKLLVLRVEVIAWLIYTLVALTQFFTESLWVTAALLVVVGLVGLNFWRDFFPGLLMRTSNKFKSGDPIRFEDYAGTIQKLGRTSLHVKTTDEELVFIPYRKVNNGVLIKRQVKGKLRSNKLIFQIGTKSPGEVVEKVNKWLLECPWAIPQGSNNVTVQPGGLLHVTVYAVDEVSLGKTERFINSRLEAL